MRVPVIRCEGFTLRPFRKGDENSIVENISNVKIARALGPIPYPYRIWDALSWIDHTRKVRRKRKKIEINFAIDKDGEVIGGIGLSKIDGYEAEIGFWLGERYWGRGIMTSAVEAITVYALADLSLDRLYGHVFPSNKASVRVLEKAGYRYENRLRRHVVKNGRRRDCLLFASVR